MQLSAQRLRPSRTRTVLVTAGLLTTLLCSSGWVQAAAPPHDFTILTPRFGSSQMGQVDVKLQYVTHNEDPTVKVQLNGRAINTRRFIKSCQGSTCTITGKLTVWDGLRAGENQLFATLAGRLYLPTPQNVSSSKPVLLERTRFDYAYSGNLGGGGYNTVNYYTPTSLGLSTLPGGGGNAGTPWLQLTTGYPADWNAVADAYAFPNPPGPPDQNGHPTTINTITIPYPDISEGFTCLGAPFQAYVLGRQNPYQGGPNDQYVETGACFNSISDLQTQFQTKFQRALGNQDLVVMSTAPGQTVPAAFDSSALGGTNYSQTPATEYPQAYVMIGVPGASPGTAYESFSITTTSSHPNAYTPSLNGTLMKDQNNNYNFVPSGNATFEVHSDSSTGSYINVGNNTYTPPATGASFWLLVLDQETLTPVNYYLSPDASQNCDTTTTTQSCGATYTVDNDGGNRLATQLTSLSSHDLIFLVTQGCPVPNNSVIQSSLGSALDAMGGAPYSLNFAGVTSHPQTYCSYSLVTVNDNNHRHALTDPLALSAGGAFGLNSQYGSVHGFLARNSQGLYDVGGKDQMIPNSDGTGVVPVVDYTFQQAASNQRQDWPLVDTAFPIEAYADISYQILNALGETGSRLYDVRYFYTSSAFLTNTSLGSIILNKLGTITNPATGPFTEQSWDNATPTQFTAALQQIGAELQQATSAYGYLGPAGVRGQMASSTSTIYADMIGMSETISNDYSQASNANANTKLSNVANLLAGVAGIAAAIPEIGPIFGVVNGALTIGSAVVSLNNNPPSPEAVFDDSLSNFTKDATTYTANLTLGFDGAVDNILSDAGKLATIGTLTLNTDSAWNFPSQISQDQLQAPLIDAAARSIWLDVLPQIFGIRQFPNGPSPNPGDYGFPSDDPVSCNSYYSGIDPSTYGAFTTIGNNKRYDLYVFGEGVNPSRSGGPQDKTVSKELASLLTASGQITIGGVEQDGLNLPAMLLYGYSNLNYAPFANGGFGSTTYCGNQ